MFAGQAQFTRRAQINCQKTSDFKNVRNDLKQ